MQAPYELQTLQQLLSVYSVLKRGLLLCISVVDTLSIRIDGDFFSFCACTVTSQQRSSRSKDRCIKYFGEKDARGRGHLKDDCAKSHIATHASTWNTL